MSEQGGQLPTEVLADQLILPQPDGADYAPPPSLLLVFPPLGSFLRH